MARHGLYEKEVEPTLYEKQAGILGGLGHMLMTAAGGHVSTNAVGLAAHHHSNVGDFLAHRGLQHGLDGQHLSAVAKQSIKSIFGPESLITYEAGHGLAQKLLQESPHPDDRLQNMMGLLQKHVDGGTPVFGPLQKAVAHHVTGTAPVAGGVGAYSDAYAKVLDHLTSKPMHGMETLSQKIVKNVRDAVPAAAFAGADAALSGGVPLGAVGHAGWNGLRQVAGHTDVGQKIMVEEVVKGLAGETPSKLQEAGFNLGFSPAYLDARRLGLRTGEHLAEVNRAATHPHARAAIAAARSGANVARGGLASAHHSLRSIPEAAYDHAEALHNAARHLGEEAQQHTDALRQGAAQVSSAAGSLHATHRPDVRRIDDFLRAAPQAASAPGTAARDYVARNRAEVERAVGRQMEKALGEPAIRVLPHIKVERPVVGPSMRPAVRSEF